jgi:hypothetical protein
VARVFEQRVGVRLVDPAQVNAETE